MQAEPEALFEKVCTFFFPDSLLFPYPRKTHIFRGNPGPLTASPLPQRPLSPPCSTDVSNDAYCLGRRPYDVVVLVLYEYDPVLDELGPKKICCTIPRLGERPAEHLPVERLDEHLRYPHLRDELDASRQTFYLRMRYSLPLRFSPCVLTCPCPDVMICSRRWTSGADPRPTSSGTTASGTLCATAISMHSTAATQAGLIWFFPSPFFSPFFGFVVVVNEYLRLGLTALFQHNQSYHSGKLQLWNKF